MGEIVPLAEKMNTVKATLADPKMLARIKSALPRVGVTPERFLQLAYTTLQRQPKLVECDMPSLLGCFMMSAQSGLDPSGVTGEAYLVPYGKQATFIPGYKGLMKMAYRSGEVASINAECVRKGDDFDFALGLEPHLSHVPKFATNRDEDITHVYCIASLKGGGQVFRVMPIAAVNAIRQRSRAGTSGPWVSDFSAMAIKTVVRQTLKFVPLAAADMRLLTAAEDEERGSPQDFSDLLVDEPKQTQVEVRDEKGTPTIDEFERELNAKP